MKTHRLWMMALLIAALWAGSAHAGEEVESIGGTTTTGAQGPNTGGQTTEGDQIRSTGEQGPNIGGQPTTSEDSATGTQSSQTDIPGDREAARALFHQGNTAYTEHRYQDAAGFFRQAHEEWPHPFFLFNIGQSYRRHGDNEHAVQAYQQYIDGWRPTASESALDPAVYINQAECFHALGRTQEARQALQHYLDAGPGGPDRSTAEESIQSGRSPAEHGRRDPQDVAQARTLHDQAQALFEQGQFREAAQRFLEGYRRFNTMTEFLESAAVSYERAEMWSEAARTYRQFLETPGARPEAHISLAHCLNRLGQYAEATAAYRRYLEVEPRGEYADHAREYIRSMTEARGGQGGAPPSAETMQRVREHLNRGTEHYLASRYGEALNEFGRAYGLLPSKEILFNMGMCHYRLRQWARALTDFENVLRAGDRGADAMVHLRAAECLLGLSRAQEAERHVRDYLSRADEAELPDEQRDRQLATQLLARIRRSGGS